MDQSLKLPSLLRGRLRHPSIKVYLGEGLPGTYKLWNRPVMYEEQLLILMPYRGAPLEFDYSNPTFHFMNYTQEQFIPPCRCDLITSPPSEIPSGAFNAFGHIRSWSQPDNSAWGDLSKPLECRLDACIEGCGITCQNLHWLAGTSVIDKNALLYSELI